MERLEDLQLDGLKIYQDPELYTFTSDAVILANFVNAKHSDFVYDLGTGSGIIAILVAYKTRPKKVIGIELQSELARLAQKSVKLNHLEKLVEIKNEDMLELTEAGEADIVVCNPPYKKRASAFINPNESLAIARHEIKVDLDGVINTASKLLKDKGKFYVCLDANRTAELIFKLKEKRLEPKKMFFTAPKLEADCNIVFIEAVKGGREDLKVLSTLITNDPSGNYLEEVKTYRRR